MPLRVLLIVNPAAAAGRDQTARLERLRGALQQRGAEVVTRATQASGHAIELAAEAAREFDVVVAVGGDGTAHEVTSGLLSVTSPTALFAPAPFGTGNDVAQLLGVHREADLVGAVAGGRHHRWDAIEVRCHSAQGPVVRHALLFAACGYAVELLRQTTPAVKRWFGPRLCYSVGFLRALASYRQPRLGVRAGEFSAEETFLHVAANNAPHAGGGVMRIAPGARVDDGRMEICLIRQTNGLEPLWQFPRLLRGTHVHHPKTRYFPAAEMQIESDQPVEVAADGELIGVTPAHFTLRAGALRVVAGGRQ